MISDSGSREVRQPSDETRHPKGSPRWLIWITVGGPIVLNATCLLAQRVHSGPSLRAIMLFAGGAFSVCIWVGLRKFAAVAHEVGLKGLFVGGAELTLSPVFAWILAMLWNSGPRTESISLHLWFAYLIVSLGSALLLWLYFLHRAFGYVFHRSTWRGRSTDGPDEHPPAGAGLSS